jgi:hypothetical protein
MSAQKKSSAASFIDQINAAYREVVSAEVSALTSCH